MWVEVEDRGDGSLDSSEARVNTQREEHEEEEEVEDLRDRHLPVSHVLDRLRKGNECKSRPLPRLKISGNMETKLNKY